MITVVCMKIGTKYSAEYVNHLQAQVHSSTSVPYKFLCVTDDPLGVLADCAPPCTDLTGWWPKLSLFSQSAYGIEDKLLFLDLDVIITGNLDSLLEYPSGFCIIQDFLKPGTYNSSVFLLRAGFLPHVWAKFRPVYIPDYRGGDQQWIFENAPGADYWPPEWCVSYKLQAKTSVPLNARIVCFHGKPKPPDVLTGSWVDKYWRSQ